MVKGTGNAFEVVCDGVVVTRYYIDNQVLVREALIEGSQDPDELTNLRHG